MAKTMGRKDLMKEVKKLATFQDKALKGKVKGHTEAWLVQVCRAYIQYVVHACVRACVCVYVCVVCACTYVRTYARKYVTCLLYCTVVIYLYVCRCLTGPQCTVVR